MRELLSVGLGALSFFSQAYAYEKYETRLECVNAELQKYSQPTQAALAVATTLCAERFERREKAEARKIRECGYKYDDAVEAGLTHQELVDYMKRTKPKCLR